MIIHGIRKTLHKERKMMAQVDDERKIRQLRQIVNGWRFEGKIKRFQLKLQQKLAR
jgi:hypothetical protein